MSVPATEEWFSISIRRNRKSFLLAVILLLVVLATGFLLTMWIAQTSKGRLIGMAIFLGPGILGSYLLGAQRLRDFGVSGWWTVLWIPLGFIENEAVSQAVGTLSFAALCAIPGTPGANRFGPDPLHGLEGDTGKQLDET